MQNIYCIGSILTGDVVDVTDDVNISYSLAEADGSSASIVTGIN